MMNYGKVGKEATKKLAKMKRNLSRDFDADSEGAKEFKLKEAMDRAFA